MNKSLPPDEVWLKERWRDLRRDLQRVIAAESTDAIDALCGDDDAVIDEAFTTLHGRVLSAVERRRRQSAGAVARFLSMGLSVLTHFDEVKSAALGGRVRLRAIAETDDPLPFFRHLIARGLNRARRSALPHDPARSARWERLDRISRDLARPEQLAGVPVRRCSEEHFVSLHNYIARNCPNDHNLPRKIDTIADYFYEFCDECTQSLDRPGGEKYLVDESDTLADDAGFADFSDADTDDEAIDPDTMPGIDSEELHLALNACLAALPPTERGVLMVLFGLDAGFQMTVERYCRIHGISRRRFYQLKNRALGLLKDCISAKGVIP